MAGPFRAMTTEDKLDLLAGSARYDVCLASCSTNAAGGIGRVRDPNDPLRRWLYPAHVPGKGQVHILKVLQTNACSNSCTYCAFSSRRDDQRRTTFSPDELAELFMKLVRARLAHGLFLSSGVCGNAAFAMERMIRTAEILRFRHRYGGYLHLKVLPGSPDEMVERAAALANRLSVNLEAPVPARLAAIAPEKRFREDLVRPMRKIASLLASEPRALPDCRLDTPRFGMTVPGTRERTVRTVSQTTQFVVGASNETDYEIFRTVDWVYRDLSVFRAYFSAYQPIGPDMPPAFAGSQDPLLREHRLYQADFLLRGYGFSLDELVFDGSGSIPAAVDPKTAWAMLHPERYPVDVNRATLEELLRVPGIGPVSAGRIVRQRAESPLRNLDELAALGVRTGNASGYVQFSGRIDRGLGTGWRQAELFAETAPPDWKTGAECRETEPGRRDRTSDPAAARRSATSETSSCSTGTGRGAPARYPGQAGMPLYYERKRTTERVYCR
jgi:predicted DNA-binding helix-hairpin-helix protein